MRKIDRQRCIADVRDVLLRLVDEEHSICEVAANRGIFCRGFAQWSLEELRRRYDWIEHARPNLSRAELERLANAWQLARQQVYGCSLACDTQTEEHDTCRGWDDFTDAQLEAFHASFCHEPVEIAR
jgi:hypothetical protein